MSHPNKDKGNRWETALVELLGDVKKCTRVGDHFDTGDLLEIEAPSWVMEAKDDQSHSLQAFIGQMLTARERTGRRWGVVLLKARMRSAEHGYAIMPIWLWDDLRKHLRQVEQELTVSRAECAALALELFRGKA